MTITYCVFYANFMYIERTPSEEQIFPKVRLSSENFD